jgi:hypothetical protein
VGRPTSSIQVPSSLLFPGRSASSQWTWAGATGTMAVTRPAIHPVRSRPPMTSSHLIAVTCQWFSRLASALDCPSAPRLAGLFLCAVLARGRRTVTTWIRAAKLSDRFQSCYTAVAAAGRRADRIARRILTEVVLPLVKGAGRLTLALDDTEGGEDCPGGLSCLPPIPGSNPTGCGIQPERSRRAELRRCPYRRIAVGIELQSRPTRSQDRSIPRSLLVTRRGAGRHPIEPPRIDGQAGVDHPTWARAPEVTSMNDRWATGHRRRGIPPAPSTAVTVSCAAWALPE